MSTHNIIYVFVKNEKDISIFSDEKAPYLLLCEIFTQHAKCLFSQIGCHILWQCLWSSLFVTPPVTFLTAC